MAEVHMFKFFGMLLAEFDNWVCMECHAQFGNHRYHRCPKCGSYEVENIG